MLEVSKISYGNLVAIVTDPVFELLSAASCPSTKIEPLTALPSMLLTIQVYNSSITRCIKCIFPFRRNVIQKYQFAVCIVATDTHITLT
jgi:hypothetical protein